MKKVLLTMALALMTSLAVNAQQDIRSMYWSPEKHEKVLGSNIFFRFEGTFYKDSDPKHYDDGYSDKEIYSILLNKAKQDYPNRSNLIIRDVDKKYDYNFIEKRGYNIGITYHYYGFFSVVVEDSKLKSNLDLNEAVSKALTKVPNGARMAIDQITVPYSINSDDFKDQLLDILIDKGYRIVAKEYLQKLYQEQQDQLNSGLYNPDTMVEGSKFSAVGYFINVKVTETSIRVQVVNVSTGEYEGNATVNF
jgi:hypothetical protein